ncbi:MAG: hypothetical protein IKB98_04055 [Clostridia bacterium]|nr:hypothetical protein [Clostridia bacterium]
MKPKKFCLYKVIDTLLWTLILLLPIILYAIHIVHHDSISLLDFISQKLSISFNQDSIIYVGIEKLFTNGFGFFDIFNDMGFALEFFVWFFFVEFVHLAMDILVSLPRLFHEFMFKFSYNKE